MHLRERVQFYFFIPFLFYRVSKSRSVFKYYFLSLFFFFRHKSKYGARKSQSTMNLFFLLNEPGNTSYNPKVR